MGNAFNYFLSLISKISNNLGKLTNLFFKSTIDELTNNKWNINIISIIKNFNVWHIRYYN